MYLIVGATGQPGSLVARKLLADGQPLRAMSRTPAKADALKELGAEVVQGDLCEPASLARACQGVNKVLAAAHAFEAQGGNNPQTVDGAGNRHLIDAARAAGVNHFVFISILGVGPQAPLDFFRFKNQAEEYLKASSLSYTILRAAALMESWAALVGGPENLTLNQVAEIFEKVAGRPASKSHMPLPVMRVMSVVMRPFNPALARQIAAGVFMDTADQTFDMSETLKLYPVKLTRLEDYVRRTYELDIAPVRGG